MDYNDFYVKSMQAGAQTDQFGNIQHTPGSIATMAAMQEHQAFVNQTTTDLMQDGHGKEYSFWGWFFDGN